MTARHPEANATGVALNATITLTFSVAMDRGMTEGSFALHDNDAVVPGATHWEAGSTKLVFTPADELTPGVTYRIQVDETATSAAGVPLAEPETFTFTSAFDPVMVVSLAPVDGAADVSLLPYVTIAFSTAMDPASTAAAVTLEHANGPATLGPALFNDALTELSLIPTGPLDAKQTYTLRVGRQAESQQGITLAAEVTATFTTADISDTEAPNLSIAAIEPSGAVLSGPDLAEDGGFSFSGTVSDADSGLAWVAVQVLPGDETLTADWRLASRDGDTWSYQWYPRTLDPAPHGSYLLHVVATDRGGNQTSESSGFEVDVEPPPVPVPTEPIPATWKFKTLVVELTSAGATALAVTLNAGELTDSPVAVDGLGQAVVAVELPQQSDASVLSVVAMDDTGNRSEPLTAEVVRSGYTCLTASNGFPLDTAEVLSLHDDEEGNVTLTYRLDAHTAEDTYIGPDAATSSHGIEQLLAAGCDPEFRILFRFEPGLLPACSRVSGATLLLHELTCSVCTLANDISAHPLTRGWNELTATWNQAEAGQPWSAGGGEGDYQGAGSGFRIDEPSSVATIDLSAAAKSWSEQPATNFGFVALVNDTGSRSYYATNNLQAGFRPELELVLVENP